MCAAIFLALSTTFPHARLRATPPTARLSSRRCRGRRGRRRCRRAGPPRRPRPPRRRPRRSGTRGLVALAVGRGARDDLDLAAGSMRTEAASQPPLCRRTPAATLEGERPPLSVKLPMPMPICLTSRPRGGGAARRATLRSRRAPGPSHAGLVVAGVVHHAGGGRRRLVERGDQVLYAQLRRVHVELARQVVHDALVGVGGLRTAGPAVGVGRGEVREDAGAFEGVGVEGVEAGVGEGAEDGDARRQELQVRAHVREQPDLHAQDLAVAPGGELDVLDLAAAVGVARWFSERSSTHLTGSRACGRAPAPAPPRRRRSACRRSRRPRRGPRPAASSPRRRR